MNYEEWEKGVPEALRADSLWKMKAYRYALFLSDVGWYDASRLVQDPRTVSLSDQLYRAVGSIGANLAEGYSRGTGSDRARFYEYALGSARECRNWYFLSRHVLGEDIVKHRLELLAEIIPLLLTMIPQQRGRSLREETEAYAAEMTAQEQTPAHLLKNVPLPKIKQK